MMLSVHTQIDYVIKSVKAGAKGYVIKESVSECIIKCLEQISQGKQFIDHSLSDQLCELMNNIEIPVNDIKEYQKAVQNLLRNKKHKQFTCRIKFNIKSRYFINCIVW